VTVRLDDPIQVLDVFDVLSEEKDYSAWQKSVRQVREELREAIGVSCSESYVAYSAEGRPLALIATLCDGELAWVVASITACDEQASDARYLLHTSVVGGLAQRSCRMLVTNTMMARSSGTSYLLQRLGFQPVNLVVLGRWARSGRMVGPWVPLR